MKLMPPGAVMLTALLSASPAAAQGAPAIKPAFAGDCAVVVTLSGQREGDVVQVLLGLGMLPSRAVVATDKTEIEIATGSPLTPGDTLRLLINGSEVASARTTTAESDKRPKGAKPVGKCAAVKDAAFKGESLKATAYFGWAFDQFAPDSLGGYPPGTLTSKTNRVLFGVDFDYRMAGTDTSKMQLWLAGETMHGVRSADIDCTAETNKPPECNPTGSLAYARAVLADATSLEAYIAPRLRFARLQTDSSTPTRLYATARFGFIALDDAPRVFKNHHVGMGLEVDDGPFEGSAIELGWGMNEMLSGRKWKRFKVDGIISFPVPLMGDTARFFVEMFIDNDLKGNTPDSIQTFIGVDLDIRKFFGGGR